ncbi:hypothetical protein DICSQDRAFT_171278 [Dichomitus squalens LYAD-421 SS1]|uniref:G protein-coupled receptor n=1 Tax=Dichomitus squalens (strain LYAD-421) TaxID=732165 RepID=R7SW69_DICSQ|nr:uncharacterized protein DICSQDRAFT_171278 [Dichomitus squalens LYAD-421 SS1]EJF60321.1 hypothetical protein DICSQDRAFT_171278 [Dichomitus squalens LYAD-421 SS1]
MADKFPIDVAQIVALFLESMFYGLYLVSFGMCMYTMLLKSRSRHRQRTVFLVVALLLFIFATLDVALLLRHVLDAFVWYHGPGGAIGEFSDISYWVNAMKTVNYVAQTSIADGMLIYRCYIVYGGNWLVPVPLCILWIAGMIVEAFTCYIEFTLHSDAFLNAGQLTPFITSTLSITLVLNLIATSMIVYKIWSIERRSRAIFTMSSVASGTEGLRRAMRIIIESGLMYSVGVIVFFVVYLANNNAQYGVSDCVVQIIGISFNLIIIRIDQGKSVESSYPPNTLQMTSAGSRSGTFPAFRFTRRTGTHSSITNVDERDIVGRDHPIAMVSFAGTSSSPDKYCESASGTLVKVDPVAV